jgi:hypothetical protein
MTRPLRTITLAVAGALTLAGCATGPGPVEVTRFHDPARLQTAERGSVAIVAAPGVADGLELAPYRAAVAEELRRLGFRVVNDGPVVGTGRYRAEVRVDRFARGSDGRRSPVSVGVGGSTGTFGSGIGLGIGINLGGGGGERVGSELAVTLREASSNTSVWEGRAEVEYSPRSDFANARTNATVLAEALFRGFPGNSGETVRVSAGR